MKYSNYSLFSKELSSIGLEGALDRTLKLGFDSVEHIEVCARDNAKHFLNSLSEAKDMHRELSARGLSVTCYSLGIDLLDENFSIARQMDFAIRNIEYAAALGSKFFHHTLIIGYDKDKMIYTLDDAYNLIADRAETLARWINDYGMTCLYEPQGLYFNGVRGVEKILSGMRERGVKVGICGDTGNSIFVDCMPTDVYRAFASDIKHIHVKDYTYGRQRGKRASLGGKLIDYERMGEGDCAIAECFSLVPDYERCISFEMVGDDDEMSYSRDYVKG